MDQTLPSYYDAEQIDFRFRIPWNPVVIGILLDDLDQEDVTEADLLLLRRALAHHLLRDLEDRVEDLAERLESDTHLRRAVLASFRRAAAS